MMNLKDDLPQRLAYWKHQLEGAPQALTVPTDHRRPVIQTYQGRSLPFKLSCELTARLNTLCKQEGVSLFSALLTTFQVLLARYSGQCDFVIGTPVTERRAFPELTKLIGYFVNVVPIRSNLSGNPSFCELLSKMDRICAEAFAYELPFEQIIEMIQPVRDASHAPIFQVLFTLQDKPDVPDLIGDAQMKLLDPICRPIQYDLDFILQMESEHIQGQLLYNIDLFEARTIQRLLMHFQTLLESVVAHPQYHIVDLELLPAEDREQLLFALNANTLDYPSEQAVHQLVARQVTLTPDVVALISRDEHLTYSELDLRSSQLASVLQSAGVRPEVRVGIYLERSISLIITFLAISKAGGACVPLDIYSPHYRLRFMIDDAQIALLITLSTLQDRLPPLNDIHVLCLDREWARVKKQSDEIKDVFAYKEQLALVLYTSGSTGQPKGVALSQMHLLNHTWFRSVYAFSAAERACHYAPPSSSLALFEIFFNLCSGTSIVLLPDEVVKDIPNFLAQLAHYAVTWLFVVPSLMRVMLEYGEGALQQLSTLRWCTMGGEPLPWDLYLNVKRSLYDVTVIHSYGATEFKDIAFFNTQQLDAELQSSCTFLPMGYPIVNMQFYVLDKHLQPVPIGVIGELYVGGITLARGYLNQPALTAERFIPHPFSKQPGRRLYRTGDLARILYNGHIEHLGRADQQVQVRGRRVELGEIEVVLRQHPTINQCKVIAFGDLPGEKRLVAYVVPERQMEISYDLRRWLKERLPDYMLPSAIIQLTALPLLPGGKVDLHALPSPDDARPDLETAYVAPRTPLEESMAQIWSQVLNINQVGINDDFFALGGHSLLIMQILSRVQSSFQVKLPARILFEAPTVAGIVEQVELELQRKHGRQLPPLQAVGREKPLPFSFGQEQFWLLDQLTPDNPFYNEAIAIQLSGQLQVVALEHSFQKIVQRHEVLRTTFAMHEGQLCQIIHSSYFCSLPLLDISALPEQRRKEQAELLIFQEAQQPFDLKEGPLFRMQLLRLGEQEHIFMLNFHHSISDGWSASNLQHELNSCYTEAVTRQAALLPELPIQYADYAYWQRQWLQGEVLEQHLRYWKLSLADAPALLNLPTDWSRPAIFTYRGARISFHLDASLTQELQALSLRQGSTLFMTLLAAFTVLLWRYSGQEDIVVGTPVANRHQAELEPLIGFFVNTVVLRNRLWGRRSFAHLLAQVREGVLGAYAHQDLPFERLVEALEPERSLSYTPLFQVMFILQNTPQEDWSLPGLQASPVEIDNGTTKFDLTLEIQESEAGLKGTFEYSTDLFEAATIQRMIGHWSTLLAGIVKDVGQLICELPLLTAKEQYMQLNIWNATSQAYPNLCLHELFEEQVKRQPEAIAVEWGEYALTYKELNRRANQLANFLRTRGVGPEVVVGLYLERSLNILISILAILKAGGAYVPLDPLFPASRLDFILEDAQVFVLLTQQSLAANLTTYKSQHIICLDVDRRQISCESSENMVSGVGRDNLAYVIYTSGSTGRPKGVLASHQAAVNRFAWMWQKYPFTYGERCCQKTSLSFVDAVWETLGPPLQGCCLVLAPHEIVLDANVFTRWLAEQGITRIVLVPSLLRTILSAFQQMQFQLHLLRLWICSGEELRAELVNDFCRLLPSCTLLNLYGSSEVAADATWYEIPFTVEAFTSIPVGRPLANTAVYLLDSYLQLVPVGIPGEIFICGAGLARGYLCEPALTAERFLPDPFNKQSGSRMYRTGDFARYQEDGTLEFLGRRDNQVKVRGYRIELSEIEVALSQHPAIIACVATVWEYAPGDLRLVAYIVKREARFLSGNDLQEYLKDKLPLYMIPSIYVPLEKLPLNFNGKIDRHALSKPEHREGKSDTARTPIEEMLATIWFQVLGVENLRIDDNFFAIGGHSLLAVQINAQIAALLNVEMSVQDIFEAPTIAALAKRILRNQHEKQGTQAPPLVRSPRGVDTPLSFSQQRLWLISQMMPAMPLYTLLASVWLQGIFDLSAFQQSISAIIQRHEILQTTYLDIQGYPIQRNNPMQSIPFVLIDLDMLTSTDQEAQVHLLSQQESRRLFDLAHGPLLHVSLLRCQKQMHLLLISMHHINSDGWSKHIFIRELSAYYTDFCNNTPSALAPLPIQYADYAHWQRQWLQGEVLEQHLRYWKQALLDAPALLNLPTDRPRPAIFTYRGARISFHLDASLTRALQALSLRQGSTLFMTLLAAFTVLLWRYSGQEDIVVGTPVANRHQAKLEPLIGFFVNTVVLRNRLRGRLSFAHLLAQVREGVLGAYAHQDLPFERLVEALEPERSLSSAPLFQVMFILQNTPQEPWSLPGLQASPVEIDNGTTKFDLTLEIQESEAGLKGTFEYSTDLFEAATIQRMIGHWSTLLAGIVKDVGQPICELPLLTVEERHMQLEQWNMTQTSYPHARAVHKLFETQVKRVPEAPAILIDQRSVSYAELNRRANQLAHYLKDCGIKPEVLVGLWIDRSLYQIIALLAVLKAGGAYVPLDPDYPQDRLAFCLTDSRVAVVLTLSHMVNRIPQEGRRVLELDHMDELLAQYACDDPVVEVEPDNLMYVMYTSGSTGIPKGVALTQRAICNYLQWSSQSYIVAKGHGVPLHSSIGFDLTVTSLFVPLLVGEYILLTTERSDQRIEALVFARRAHPSNQVFSFAKLTPTHLNLLSQQISETEAAAYANTLILGGEALQADHVAFWRAHAPESRIINEYGPTEAAVGCCTYEIPADFPSEQVAIPIGRPIANMQLYVLDPYLQPVPIGVPGELYIGGVGLARGYWERPDSTAERFRPHPFSQQPGARLYKTGDSVRYHSSGTLEFLKRSDNQVKLRGYRIELGEIEAVLRLHTKVKNCTIIVHEYSTEDKRLIAYIVPIKDSVLTAQELRDYVQKQLPAYMMPSRFVFLDSLPLTTHGKIDVQALYAADMVNENTQQHTSILPRNAMEQHIADIWKEVLRIDSVSIHDHFFDIGGHSLLLMQVRSKLWAAFNLDIAVFDLFKHATITSIAEYIDLLQRKTQVMPTIDETGKKLIAGKSRMKRRLLLKQKSK